LPAADPLALDGCFLAACVWRERGFGGPVSLPFWAAGAMPLRRLALQVGPAWEVGFLGCVTAAAQASSAELDRLHRAADRPLPGTARSQLAAALEAVLRAPIVTARSLAQQLDITPRAALRLIRQLSDTGLLREATGRAAWRAFVVA
jgi:ribosomal protein S25